MDRGTERVGVLLLVAPLEGGALNLTKDNITSVWVRDSV